MKKIKLRRDSHHYLFDINPNRNLSQSHEEIKTNTEKWLLFQAQLAWKTRAYQVYSMFHFGFATHKRFLQHAYSDDDKPVISGETCKKWPDSMINRYSALHNHVSFIIDIHNMCSGTLMISKSLAKSEFKNHIDTTVLKACDWDAEIIQTRSRFQSGRCGHCGRLPDCSKTFQKCSKCKSTCYCSKNCQWQAWPRHRRICQ